MHAMVVVLSKETLYMNPLSLTIDMKLKRMGFTSRTFTCQFFSDSPADVPSQYIPHPCTDASV